MLIVKEWCGWTKQQKAWSLQQRVQGRFSRLCEVLKQTIMQHNWVQRAPLESSFISALNYCPASTYFRRHNPTGGSYSIFRGNGDWKALWLDRCGAAPITAEVKCSSRCVLMEKEAAGNIPQHVQEPMIPARVSGQTCTQGQGGPCVSRQAILCLLWLHFQPWPEKHRQSISHQHSGLVLAVFYSPTDVLLDECHVSAQHPARPDARDSSRTMGEERFVRDLSLALFAGGAKRKKIDATERCWREFMRTRWKSKH